jgi:hypothetical protein
VLRDVVGLVDHDDLPGPGRPGDGLDRVPGRIAVEGRECRPWSSRALAGSIGEVGVAVRSGIVADLRQKLRDHHPENREGEVVPGILRLEGLQGL